MHASMTASDFQPMTSDAQWQWVEVPNGQRTARGITPLGRRETFCARLDTPIGVRYASAKIYVRPAAGSSVLVRSVLVSTSGRVSTVTSTTVPGTGTTVRGVDLAATTQIGTVAYAFCDLDPGDVLVGLWLWYLPGPGEFVPVTPQRLFDSRVDGPTWEKGRIAGGVEFPVSIPVPATTQGAHAAHLNVTITRSTAPGFLAVYPARAGWPGTSTLNWTGGGQTVAAGTTVGLGDTLPDRPGVDIFHDGQGEVDVIVDYTGYYRVVAGSS